MSNVIHSSTTSFDNIGKNIISIQQFRGQENYDEDYHLVTNHLIVKYIRYSLVGPPPMVISQPSFFFCILSKIIG